MAGMMLLVVILSFEENFGNGEVSHSVKKKMFSSFHVTIEARVTDS